MNYPYAPANKSYVPVKPKRKVPPRNPALRDPLIKAARKAYRESAVGQIESLLKEERRWKSKQTMANNKLRNVRERIARAALVLAKGADMRGEKGEIL